MAMATTNALFDLFRSGFAQGVDSFMLFFAVAVGLASALPSFAALSIASRTNFKIRGTRVYAVAADAVLLLSLCAYGYLLLVRERPDYYPGASHLYVATWPVFLGLVAITFYLACLALQGLHWLRSKKVNAR